MELLEKKGTVERILDNYKAFFLRTKLNISQYYISNVLMSLKKHYLVLSDCKMLQRNSKTFGPTSIFQYHTLFLKTCRLAPLTGALTASLSDEWTGGSRKNKTHLASKGISGTASK